MTAGSLVRMMGMEWVVEQLGVRRVIEQLGPRRFIEELGTQRLIEELGGVDELRAQLTPEQRRRLKRQL